MLLLTPTNMLLHPIPYSEIPKQPWNPMLDSANPVNSTVTKSQPAQYETSETQVYVSKAQLCPYGLFPIVYMVPKVRVPCVYNYPPWGIHKLTISELAILWDVPLLLQEKLEELDKNPC